MPKRLSHYPPSTLMTIGTSGHTIFYSNPKFASLVMQVISEHSNVEAFMMRTYVTLAGGAKSDASTIFLSLNTAGAKSKAISALAEKKLTPNYVKILSGIMKLAKTAQKHRDKLCHWQWGTATSVHDGLILVDPRKQIKYDPRDFDAEPTDMLVYTEKDFRDMYEACHCICGLGLRFTHLLAWNCPDETDTQYQELCAVPALAEILNH